MVKEKNEKNVATLNEHAHIAVQVLTEKEGNPSQSSLNKKTEQHFLKWAVSLRKDVASAVAGKYPDFASVVELIKTATEAQKKGKAIRGFSPSAPLFGTTHPSRAPQKTRYGRF